MASLYRWTCLSNPAVASQCHEWTLLPVTFLAHSSSVYSDSCFCSCVLFVWLLLGVWKGGELRQGKTVPSPTTRGGPHFSVRSAGSGHSQVCSLCFLYEPHFKTHHSGHDGAHISLFQTITGIKPVSSPNPSRTKVGPNACG